MSTGYQGYTTRPEVKLVGVPQLPRHLDKLNLVWGIRLKGRLPNESSADLKRGLWCDVSQNVHRGSQLGLGGTLTTSTLMYSFERDCVLDGEDHMRLQGWPIALAASDDFSSAEKKELAGEGYNLACLAVACTGCYFNPYGSWWGSAA